MYSRYTNWIEYDGAHLAGNAYVSSWMDLTSLSAWFLQVRMRLVPMALHPQMALFQEEVITGGREALIGATCCSWLDMFQRPEERAAIHASIGSYLRMVLELVLWSVVCLWHWQMLCEPPWCIHALVLTSYGIFPAMLSSFPCCPMTQHNIVYLSCISLA